MKYVLLALLLACPSCGLFTSAKEEPRMIGALVSEDNIRDDINISDLDEEYPYSIYDHPQIKLNINYKGKKK